MILDAHGIVRHETGEGGLMFCVGLLRNYTGANLQPAQIKTSAKKKYNLPQIQSILREAVKAHHDLFGKDIKDLLDAIESIHSWGGQWLTTFMVSKNLTNAIHIDFKDRSNSFAVFFNLIKNNKHYIFNSTNLILNNNCVYTWFAFPQVSKNADVCCFSTNPFPTNPNKITNCFQLFSLLQLL